MVPELEARRAGCAALGADESISPGRLASRSVGGEVAAGTRDEEAVLANGSAGGALHPAMPAVHHVGSEVPLSGKDEAPLGFIPAHLAAGADAASPELASTKVLA